MAIDRPKHQILTFGISTPTVTYQVDPVRGRLPKPDLNYVEVEQPEGIPTYAIANLQDFYLTPSPDSFIIPLFLNLPEVFFSEFDQYWIVSESDRLNLPLIAYFFYQQAEYWWILAIANDISNPFQLKNGTILRIPSEEVIINKWLQRPVRRRVPTDEFVFSS